MLKKLFYASASILMLAIAYHLGAQSARAQGGTIAAAEAFLGNYGQYSIVIGRTLYTFSPDTNNGGTTGTRDVLSIPGTSPVIACLHDGGEDWILLENGDCWVKPGTDPWAYQGNVLGAATPAAQQTFGQLKAQYRR